MWINTDKLRQDMLNDCRGAFYGGGFGGALMESFDIERMRDEEVVSTALRKGINLYDYEVDGPDDDETDN